MPSSALRSYAISAVVLAALAAPAHARQPAVAAAPQPVFTPDHANGIYATGERIGWTMTFPTASQGVATRYAFTIRQNGGDVLSTGAIDLTRGSGRIETRP